MDFETLLNESSKIHGHLCPGQVLGVRMSILGLQEIGVSDPRGADRKKLIVFVEMDRCATDAVQSVTGCTLGHRTMKFFDYGKMAATFFNLESGRAVRVLAREKSRDRAKELLPGHADVHKAQLEAYKVMADEDLFDWRPVTVELDVADMPGRPLSRVRCDRCGEHVQDCREVRIDGATLCRACAHGAYFRTIENDPDSCHREHRVHRDGRQQPSSHKRTLP
ncbi:MAG: TraR/DksA C4-type zinc finger protein [Deltaproteobacteria bacterium]|nr:TraR/DksA C4-type zinc finger protein [Deltaproteobacteria bacterium]